MCVFRIGDRSVDTDPDTIEQMKKEDEALLKDCGLSEENKNNNEH